jgi:type IV fimbrial biogenesis protein FimT
VNAVGSSTERDRRSPSRNRREVGFTLIEMMTVVTVMAIMMAFAVPGMADLLESQRLRSATFDLVADLTLARNESLKRSTGVTVSPLSGTDWSVGWQVLDDGGELLRQRSPAGGKLVVTGAPASVAFNRNGRLAGAVGIIRIDLDSSALTSDAQARCVSVDMLGRARSDAGNCG